MGRPGYPRPCGLRTRPGPPRATEEGPCGLRALLYRIAGFLGTAAFGALSACSPVAPPVAVGIPGPPSAPAGAARIAGAWIQVPGKPANAREDRYLRLTASRAATGAWCGYGLQFAVLYEEPFRHYATGVPPDGPQQSLRDHGTLQLGGPDSYRDQFWEGASLPLPGGTLEAAHGPLTVRLLPRYGGPLAISAPQGYLSRFRRSAGTLGCDAGGASGTGATAPVRR